MWRGPVVAQKKEASARAKGKIFTLHAKLIAIAAEKGADMKLNTSLTEAVSSAKKDGVTTEVIERAIRRGAGLDKDGNRVEEVFYEGYGPGGIAVIVRTLTDNRNRTASNIRHIFSAYWGNLGETGSVSGFAFQYRGVIQVTDISDTEIFELDLLDTPAIDYSLGDNGDATVFTERTDLIEVRRILGERGYEIHKASFEYIPLNYTEVSDPEIVLKLYKLLEAFDDDEDVESVWNSADIDDALWKEVEARVEATRFRT